MVKRGAKVLIYPGAFTTVNGPKHWELHLRTRAIDNQVYVAGCSAARFTEDTTIYQAYGYSTIVDPMGKVLDSCGYEPGIVYSEIDLEFEEEIRKQMPYQSHKREDVYQFIDLKSI